MSAFHNSVLPTSHYNCTVNNNNMIIHAQSVNVIDHQPSRCEQLPLIKVDLVRHKGKSQQAQEDQDIQARNEKMSRAEAEQDSENKDEAPPPKKPRKDKTPAPSLDDEEMVLASQLGPPDIPKGGEEESRPALGDGAEAMVVDKDLEEDDDNVQTKEDFELKPNGALIVKEGPVTEAPKRKRDASKKSSSEEGLTPTRSTSGKVVQSRFEGNLRNLAIQSKSFMRLRIFSKTPFPPADPVERTKFGWSVIQEAANNSPDKQVFQPLLAQVSMDCSLKQDMITFAGYTRGAVTLAISGKARDQVKEHYNLDAMGDEEIVASVAWLLKDGNFKHNNIDINKQTYEKLTPFENSIFLKILRSQFLSTRPKAQKTDALTTAFLKKEQAIPIVLIILAVTAVEHALTEFRSGVQVKSPFKEDGAALRFNHFMSVWKPLEKTNWAKKFPSRMFNRLMKGDNPAPAAESKELEDIDISELEKKAAMAEEEY
ncbi:hypothetical protein BDN72DRAFT_964827 [Pluteus cervinus]|uniref:Uncharacterized protein n=1 Tax=Pluteus cervinus TaxID=181527 RepID=A0ACD3A9L0_9AGAR|nr:hypothetical protein BDN72DRAFT_964827 [Pluteus cervinus]